jgi:hypothetical protein
MYDKINAYNVFVELPEGKKSFRDIGYVERITLKRILTN